MGVCKDGDLRRHRPARPSRDAALPVILDGLRRRWSADGASVSDRQITVALRRVIENDA